MQDLAIKKQGIFILHYSECRAARLPRPRIKMAPVCRGGEAGGGGEVGRGREGEVMIMMTMITMSEEPVRTYLVAGIEDVCGRHGRGDVG